jgi:hypothetical protein
MAVCWQHPILNNFCIWLCAPFRRCALRSRVALAGLLPRRTHDNPRTGLQLLLLLLIQVHLLACRTHSRHVRSMLSHIGAAAAA